MAQYRTAASIAFPEPTPPGRLRREAVWFAPPAGLLAAGAGLFGLAGGWPALAVPAGLIAGAGALGLLRAVREAEPDDTKKK